MLQVQKYAIKALTNLAVHDANKWRIVENAGTVGLRIVLSPITQ
jgi:hypothetical protein